MNEHTHNLKQTLQTQQQLIREIHEHQQQSPRTQTEKKLTNDIIQTLTNRIKILNNTLPTLTQKITLTQPLPTQPQKQPQPNPQNNTVNITINKQAKQHYTQELNISNTLIQKLKKEQRKHHTRQQPYKTNPYGKFANKYYLKTSEELINKGTFKTLSNNIKKSNINILAPTYISMMLLTTTLATLLAITTTTTLAILKPNLLLPLLTLPLIIPTLTFTAFYTYPKAEIKNLAGRIDNELPFALIHMGSIAGSGIQPLEIIKIIATSKEYKHLGRELKKLISQTTIYGYDLTTALRNTSTTTPSQKLSELLNGLAVTINSGGNLPTFFEKRAESHLLDYRLTREKNAKQAETFMNLYISIVIAAPLILLMILIIIGASGIQTGFSPSALTLLIIAIVAIINIIFLTILQLKQPNY